MEGSDRRRRVIRGIALDFLSRRGPTALEPVDQWAPPGPRRQFPTARPAPAPSAGSPDADEDRQQAASCSPAGRCACLRTAPEFHEAWTGVRWRSRLHGARFWSTRGLRTKRVIVWYDSSAVPVWGYSRGRGGWRARGASRWSFSVVIAGAAARNSDKAYLADSRKGVPPCDVARPCDGCAGRRAAALRHRTIVVKPPIRRTPDGPGSSARRTAARRKSRGRAIIQPWSIRSSQGEYSMILFEARSPRCRQAPQGGDFGKGRIWAGHRALQTAPGREAWPRVAISQRADSGDLCAVKGAEKGADADKEARAGRTGPVSGAPRRQRAFGRCIGQPPRARPIKLADRRRAGWVAMRPQARGIDSATAACRRAQN